MIPFNIPPVVGDEEDYIRNAIQSCKISGDGKYTKLCNQWIEEHTGANKALLTTSCTHALEMAALLLDLKEGDEVIMPSFTFVSTADAFIMRGAKAVFVDIRQTAPGPSFPYTTRAWPARWTPSTTLPPDTVLRSSRTPLRA